MSGSKSSYEASVYDVPNVVRSMGNMLRAPRRQYSTNFTDIFSSDREEQYQYVNGLLAIMISFFIFFVFWVFVLCVLKFRGDEVGCASGQAFMSRRDDDEDLQSTDDDDDVSFASSFGPSSQTSSKSENQNSISKLVSRNGKKDSSNGSSKFVGAKEKSRRSDNDGVSVDHSDTTAIKLHHVNRRERRTRFCFILFSILSLICVPIILVTSFGPLREASRSTDQIVMTARDLLHQVNTSITTIDEATHSASVSIGSTELDIDVICPNIDENNLEGTIGVDLKQLVSSITDYYDEMNAESEGKIELIRSFIERIDGGLSQLETGIVESGEWMWIVPSVLFAVSVLTTVAMFGVVLAWRGKSGVKVQNTMSYVVLPLIMVATLACWMIVILASLGTMIGSDVCTASTSSGGSPDETIQQILNALNMDENSTSFQLVQVYTNGCTGPDPTKDLEEVKQLVQNIIDVIWQQISRIDSIGRAQIMETCGGTELEGLLLTARNIAKFLTNIRRSLDSVSNSLSCPRINPIYTAAAHDAICTDATAAAAIGFFMFFVLGMSLLTMVALRASWLQNIQGEKVYHDESEVAENMILDEHEEYLAYISKYKHEWQEYRGFDESVVDHSAGSRDEGSFSEDSESSIYFEDEEGDYPNNGGGYNGASEGSDEESPSSPGGFRPSSLPQKMTKESAPIGHSQSSSDQVSLPNLLAQESTVSASMTEEDFFKVPPSMVPPPENPDYHRKTTGDYITNHAKLTQQSSTSLQRDGGQHAKRQSSRSSLSGARNTLSRQSSKSSQESTIKPQSTEPHMFKQPTNGPTDASEPEPQIRHSSRQSERRRFFERYGIDPRASVRKVPHEVPHEASLPDPEASLPDPEARLPDPGARSPLESLERHTSQRLDSPRYNKTVYSQPNLRSSNGLPSRRAFFRAKPTGGLGEIEVQLHNTPYSPPPQNVTREEDVFEC